MISTVMFQTTNAPMPVLLPFITTWSSMYTLFAQHALFLESTSPPSSVLSCSVMPPALIDSTEIFDTDLECECVQYGGEVMEDASSICCDADFEFGCSAYCFVAPPLAAPIVWPLLVLGFPLDSIHWRWVAQSAAVGGG